MIPPFNSSPDTDTSKRICMVAFTRYPFDGRVRLEAETLVKWGHEVCFLVPKEKETATTYKLAGVTVKELNTFEYGGKSKLKYLLAYLTFILLAFIDCTSLFLRWRVRIFHIHNMPNVLVFVALIPRLFGCRVILDVHDTVVETYQAKFGKTSRFLLNLFKFEEWISCSMAQRVVCVNDVQRESVIERGIPADKIVTIVTMPRYDCNQRVLREHDETGSFKVVNHGTISQRLGNDLAIRAAERLAREIPGFELHIIGGGDGWEDCKRLAASLGLSDTVHFTKAVPWDELAKKLELMDAGIVANRVNVATELMLPSKLIDYVVLGIPAIVPRLRTIEYYFTSEMVTFFEPGNVDSIVQAVLTLYRDKPRRGRQSQNARSFLDRCSWENDSSGLRYLYNSLQ